ncbi:TipJ family phage tail tip protein [Methylobacterium sp. JK268]
MDDLSDSGPVFGPDADVRSLERTAPGAPAAIRGRKGSSGSGKAGGSASRAPDTLFSNATVRLVDLISEGEIEGVVGGLRGVYMNDVPVQNADGTYNQKGLTAEFRVGAPDQPYMAGHPDVETPQSVGATVRKATPVTTVLSIGEADRVRVIMELPALFLAKSDGSVRENTVTFRIEVRYSGGPWVNPIGDVTITGKNTSPFYCNYEFPLPVNPAGASPPWSVRVTRLTDDTEGFNNSQNKWTSQSDIIFFSLTAVQDSKFSYPHSAVVGLTADSSLFGSSLPARTYLVKGIKCQVPANYDPEARTYTGIWDGTFKEAWTNNPAWVFHEVLRNNRFGLGQFIDPATVDKFTLYNIAAYCDVMVSDGKGGREPRFTFNGQITQQADAFDLLRQISAIFRGMAFWSTGTVTAVQDRPDDVRALVTPANVIDGLITYSSSARKARHTVALVTWNDPDNLFKPQMEVVVHDEGVARYGYNVTKVDLLGCTSRGQAHREGLWRLLVENYCTQTVSYQAGLDHAVRRPGDVIAIADPAISNLDLGGRLLAGSTAQLLHLDRPVTLKGGVQYEISVVMPDGTVAERQITTAAGFDITQVAVAPALPSAPDPAAMWQIIGDVVPQLFRIVSIGESQPHVYDVSALEYEPSIYAAVDDGAAFAPLNISELPNIVLPPMNITVRESTYFEIGLPRQSLLLSWTAGQPFNSVAYHVTAVKPNGTLIALPKTANTSVEILDASSGDWMFVVQAEGLGGRVSNAVTLAYTVSGWIGLSGPQITGLALKGGGTTFSGTAPTLTWGLTWPDGVAPYPVRYVVRAFDPVTNALLRQEIVAQASYTYSFERNVADGGPRRTIKFAVAAVDAIGREGLSAAVTVTNPPPAAITPTLIWTTASVVVSFAQPLDTDFAGVLVWMSKVSGFQPSAATVAVDTSSNPIFIPGETNVTYYIRVAGYDTFGKDPTQLNIGPEVSITTSDWLIDTQAPDRPQGLALTTTLTVTATGVALASIAATWNGVTSKNLARYQFELAEGDGKAADTSWIRREVDAAQPRVTWDGLKPGVVYAGRTRSLNMWGYWSAWSDIKTIRAALNTAKPGAITGFAVSAALQSASLSWVNPGDLDLEAVEVWTGTSSPATRMAVVAAPAAFYVDATLGTAGTATYWIRPVNSSATVGDYVGPKTATSIQLTGAALAAGVIDATKLAASIVPPTAVSTLPDASKWTGSKLVLNGADSKLYRLSGGAWVSAADPVDVNSTIAAAKIKAAQITDQLTDAQIAGLSAAKVAGTLSDSQLAGISASKLVGQVVSAQIAALDASKIAGQLSDNQITGLSAAKLAGQITSTQITDSAISTPKLAAGAVVASTIAAGAITASKLQVASANVAYNGDLSQGTKGWACTYASNSASPGNFAAGSDGIYRPAGMPALGCLFWGTWAGTDYFEVANTRVGPTGVSSPYPVLTGQRIEASAWVGSHRCKAAMGLRFADASGAIVAEVWSPTITNRQPAGTSPNNPDDRLGVIATVPAKAVSVTPIFRATGTGDATPVLIVSALMIATPAPGQTELSPYVPAGVTTIDGSNIFTGSVGADKIVAKSITAGQLAAGAVTANEIAANTIVAGNIAAGAITATQIAAQTIVAGNIAAGAVTASKLAISSANYAFNGDLSQGTKGWSNAYNSKGATIANFDVGVEAQWRPAGMQALRAGFQGTWTGKDFFEVWQGRLAASGASSAYPCLPGQRVEASIWLGAHRCSAALVLRFIDATNAAVGDFVSPTFTDHAPNGTPPNNPADRVGVIATAPATAVAYYLIVRAAGTGESSPYLFVAALMIATPAAGQTELSPYVDPGVTTIDGANIFTGSISADRLVARSVTAMQIQAGTITGNEIAVNSITADKLVANSITAGQIAAGAIGVDQLAAGAITADKLGIGLNTGNLLFNSDFQTNIAGVAYNWISDNRSDITTLGWDNYWCPNGMGAVCVHRTGLDGASGPVIDIRLERRTASGWDKRYPVVAGQWYEFSAYVSIHRCGAQPILAWQSQDGGDLGATYGTYITEPGGTRGSLAGMARVYVIAQAPANSASVVPLLRTALNGGSNIYTFWTGLYLAKAVPNQRTPSDWAPGANTVIDGGQIATQSIIAASIAVGTLTGDRLAANTITGNQVAAQTLSGWHIQANSISADKIQVGGGQSLTSWLYGPDTTKINGGAIAANSISANSLKIGARGLVISGIEFTADKNSGRVSWSGGTVGWTDDWGNPVSTNVDSGYVDWKGWLTIVWIKGRKYLDWANDSNGGWQRDYANPDAVPMAFYSGWTGLNVLKGGSTVDGARIITGSVSTAQLAAAAVQADKIAAGAIQAQHIGAGQVTADKISGGTISGGNIYVGDGRLRLESSGGQSRMIVGAGANMWVARIVLGNLDPWTNNSGRWGLMIWNEAGNLILNTDGVNGQGIWANSITADKLNVGALSAVTANLGAVTAGVAQSGDGKFVIDFNGKFLSISD